MGQETTIPFTYSPSYRVSIIPPVKRKITAVTSEINLTSGLWNCLEFLCWAYPGRNPKSFNELVTFIVIGCKGKQAQASGTPLFEQGPTLSKTVTTPLGARTPLDFATGRAPQPGQGFYLFGRDDDQ